MNHGVLEVEVTFQEGRTRLGAQVQRAPLKMARALETEWPCGPGLEMCVMDASPGLLDGDSSRQHWQVRADATATVTTQGYTRVHPCPTAPATQEIVLEVEAGARLFFLPECTLPFAGARLLTRTRAEVQPGGTLVYLESLGAGRIARGERFQFDLYASQTHLRHGVNWALCAQNHIEPALLEPVSTGAWGAFTHWSNLYLVSAWTDAEWYERTAQLLETWNGNVRAGCTTLPHGGLAVSLLGGGAHELRGAVLQTVNLWQQLMGRASDPETG